MRCTVWAAGCIIHHPGCGHTSSQTSGNTKTRKKSSRETTQPYIYSQIFETFAKPFAFSPREQHTSTLCLAWSGLTTPRLGLELQAGMVFIATRCTCCIADDIRKAPLVCLSMRPSSGFKKRFE
ncbi:hypothetical protein LCI18_007258 [Fusarium solani-melongenae]|uniref:Uncharacterized protein n=1 Tax=Fusarium solani subsp. cucurbitae TaxID=2747967 RepID=A0ACD3Z506_FUSSC|nr:hypothetical protein LCI18_007258 [Fusarium solani-melongenae]